MPTTFISGILIMWTTVKRKFQGRDSSLPPYAAGYFSKMEGGVLVKTKETEYRWLGGIQLQERLSDGRPLYEIVNMEEII